MTTHPIHAANEIDAMTASSRTDDEHVADTVVAAADT
jgi:hypothetical protein